MPSEVEPEHGAPAFSLTFSSSVHPELCGEFEHRRARHSEGELRACGGARDGPSAATISLTQP